MAHRRLLVIFVCIGLLAVLAGCESRANAPASLDPGSAVGGVDINDPEVGGGIGFPDEEPVNGALTDTSPRLSGTAAAATEAAPTPTEPPLPSPTAVAPVPTTAAEQESAETPVTEPTLVPTAEPVAEDSAAEEEASVAEDDAAAAEGVDSETAETEDADPADEPERPTTHIVAPGENLYRIGLQYGVGWLALAQFNGLTNADQITVGQELQIPPAEGETEAADQSEPQDEAVAEAGADDAAAEPPPETEEETAAEPTPPPQPQAPTPSPLTETTHTVAPGDTVYRLSQLYGVSWVQIAEANGLITPNQIFIGQVLKIPVSQPGTAPEFVHNVRPGESLFRIALQYGLPLAALAEANGLQSPYVIYPGQTLLIPGITEPAP